jgi:pimeloyl-ACP methyl ester carboxylesterase
MSFKLIRRLIVYLLTISVIVVASALLIEYALEARDVARLMPGQSFAQVGDARIRYRLLGVNNPGSPVVFLSGLAGCVEQTDLLQIPLSTEVPTLAYDRAGFCFSQGSHAHTAEQQADELVGLLRVLKIDKPVLLVAYSYAAQTARVFAGRYPLQTAGMYLIDPWMPELKVVSPVRYKYIAFSGRAAVEGLIQASLGYTRLSQRLGNSQDPESRADPITEAANAGRHLRWALLTEWLAFPVTTQQTIQAPIPRTMPVEVIYTAHQFFDEETSNIVAKMYADLVARSSRGKLVEFEHVDHTHIMDRSPMLEPMIARIRQLSKESAP